MLLGAGSTWPGLCPPLLSLLPLDLASVPLLSLPPLPAPAQLSDPRPGRTLIKSGCCCCWQSKRKNFRTNSLALFLSSLMMMLARRPAQPLASCSGSLPILMAKRRQVATRHAAHRIASHRTKPFSSQWAAALSRTIYQQRFSCSSFSISLSVSAVTQDTNSRRQQAVEEAMELRP